MRIIASPSYRAFPELDRFTDEQCVRLAASSRRGPGFVVAWVVRLAAIASVFVLDVAAVSMTFGSALAPYALETLLVSALLSVGAAWLVSGDLARRWLISRVLRRGGSCGGCRYRLVGLPIGPNRTVTCPECGRALDVSLFPECCVPATDGVDRFMPSAGMVFERTPWWTASRRRVLARSAVAAVLVVVGAYCALLALAWWNVRAARSDLAQLPTAQEMCDRINRASGVRIDPLAPPKSVRELVWYDHSDVEKLRNSSFTVGNMFQPMRARWGGGSESALDPVIMVTETGSPSLSGTEFDWSITALKEWVASRGGIGRFLERMRAPVMPMVMVELGGQAASDGLDGIDMPPVDLLGDCGEAWAAIGFMEGNAAAFVDGIELELAVDRSDRSMPLVWRRDPRGGALGRRGCTVLAATAIRAAGEPVGAALAAAIERQSGEPDAKALSAAELDHRRRVLCRAMEHLELQVSHPGALWSQLGRSSFMGNGEVLFGFIPWVGMYGPQRTALDSAGIVVVEQTLLEPSARDDAAFQRACDALIAAGRITAYMGFTRWQIVTVRDAMLTWRRTLATVVAIERFRAAEGRLPESLDELVPRFVSALPKDPRSDGPLRYQRAPEADTRGFGYRLWSLASDESPTAVSPGESWPRGLEFPPN
jgi:DNA-binding transcriptional regulator of glucitol operon